MYSSQKNYKRLMFIAENMSFKEADRANELEIVLGHNGVEDPSQQQLQEIITADSHSLQKSIDELVKTMKEANRSRSMSTQKEQKDFRNWLLLLSSLAATITFAAGLSPPGGFWSEDDMANTYIAGTSVMRDKFPTRYLLFHCSNTIAFFASLAVIGLLAKNIKIKNRFFLTLVAISFLSLCGSYITGTWVDLTLGIYTISVFVAVICYMSIIWVIARVCDIYTGKKGDILTPTCMTAACKLNHV